MNLKPKISSMKFVRYLLIALALVIAAPLSAQAESVEPTPTLVVNVTTDDAWAGLAGLTFAQNVQKAGGDVVVFLTIRAVTFANAKVPQDAGAMSGKTAHEMVSEIVASGGRVFICPTCTRHAGVDIADRIDGVEVGGPEFLAIVMAPNTRIISF